jgi:pimeloyl-ACP methyl ester carboxylesterase
MMTIRNSTTTIDRVTDQAELERRYCLDASRFVEVAGVRLHHVDEAAGPAIVLLHGSYASLRQWDDWAAGLRGQFRVIRFDLPAAGLSGTDPGGDYRTDRTIAIIGALLDRLGVERCILVATSSAGTPGTAFAAQWPDRVAGLILNNIGVGPVQHDEARQPAALKAAIEEDATHPGWHREELWRQVLLANFADPARVTPAMVTRWTALNNRALPEALRPRPGAIEAEFARTIDDLPRITVPTLVLWSDRDPETPLEREGRRAFALLGTQDKALVVVPDCGHMMPEECGQRGLELAMPFLRRIASRMDGSRGPDQSRRT